MALKPLLCMTEFGTILMSPTKQSGGFETRLQGGMRPPCRLGRVGKFQPSPLTFESKHHEGQDRQPDGRSRRCHDSYECAPGKRVLVPDYRELHRHNPDTAAAAVAADVHRHCKLQVLIDGGLGR